MCGRYAMSLRIGQVRHALEDEDMPVEEAPEEDAEDAPRQSYNFAPGYYGVVYRADVPDWGAGPRPERGSRSKQTAGGRGAHTPSPSQASQAAEEQEDEGGRDENKQEEERCASDKAHSPRKNGEQDQQLGRAGVHYKLQSMKWGLIPFWTKRNPDYATVLKTINCRDDSLAMGAAGMWAPMKARKRCVVLAQGFYEWLRTGPKERVPYYIRRKDGRLMCFAGLWDCVAYEDDPSRKVYTYTVITTDSNQQLRFLHDRMPVILEPGSDALRTWLDPTRYEWSRELQDLLRPFDGELEVYAVSKEVNKAGNNSPSFIVPVASRENKANIANFFANAAAKNKKEKLPTKALKPEVEVETKTGVSVSPPPSSSLPPQATTAATITETQSLDSASQDADDGGMGQIPAATAATTAAAAAAAVAAATPQTGTKREAETDRELASSQEPPTKRLAPTTTKPRDPPRPLRSPVKKGARGKISATSNGTKSPGKAKSDGSQKITKFFANSA